MHFLRLHCIGQHTLLGLRCYILWDSEKGGKESVLIRYFDIALLCFVLIFLLSFEAIQPF